MKKRFIICLVGLMLTLTFASAVFEVGEPSHFLTETTYAPGVPIKGWINISLDQEPTDSLFEDSGGNFLTLLKLIEKNPNFDYSCSTVNCEPDYSGTDGADSKEFDLGADEATGIGLKFNENLININSISFDVNSNALSSCISQLKIDFFVDDETEFMNPHISNVSCALKNYGCYEPVIPTGEFSIGNFPDKHCQRIELAESPGFKIGAWVNRNGDSRNLTMALHDIDTGELIEGTNCILPQSEIAGEVSCEINYLNKKVQDYYVCIYSNKAGNSSIKGYSKSGGCGFYGYGTPPEIAAFSIFTEGKKFGDVGTIKVINSLQFGDTLGEFVKDYIVQKYGSLDCSKGCFVPIKIDSGVEQSITINNLEINYETVLGPTSGGMFYNLEEAMPVISTEKFQKLNLDNGNFSLPLGYGGSTFKLELNKEEIFSETVAIEQLPVIRFLTPSKTASAYPTQFEVTVEASSGITKYQWDFGDNQSLSTPENKVTHTYTSTGQYQLKVEVTDSSQRSSYRVFNILVSSPDEVINSTLIKMQGDLTNVDSQMKKFSSFAQKSLNSILDINGLNEKVKQLQRDYKSAYSEEELNNIITELLGLKIPETITISREADDITFYPSQENINLDILVSIDNEENVSDEDKYKEAILAWNQENMETKVGFEEFLATYEDFEEPLLKIFTIDVNEKEEVKHDPYLILRKLEGIDFEANYLENELDGYLYIELRQPQNTFVFSTTEDVDFTDLPLFISLPVSRLSVADTLLFIVDEDNTSKWILFFIILFLVFIIGFVIYIILQEWYKRKYESYLFKDRNDLYNMAAFIQNAKKKGMEEREISNRLRKAGWNSEQVTYTIKKYLGKRTGMIEVPIDKFLGLFKRKNLMNLPRKSQISRGYLGPQEAFKRY
ncbi:MAG: PKD domain-containing protein [Nanoarchaeota archaeon]|nr:PKD domain-containing protein [Nanoarchaeota archaeon]